jgi:hypothetical protein
MTDRYPHAPTCSSHYSAHANCDCGAEREKSAFDAGKREADARAMAVVDACIRHQELADDCPVCGRQVRAPNPRFQQHLDDCPLVSQGFIRKRRG